MLTALRELFNRSFDSASEVDAEQRAHGVQLATATLLVEVVRADYHENLTENATAFKLLREYFDLTDEEVELLVADAEAEADYSASLQAFTRQLHDQLSAEEKHRIVEMLWKVALADDHLDKHEDRLVRKIAGLLYVSHSDLIRLRNRVKQG